MSLSWEELNLLIDETLAAGEHPETRKASPMETVDNDGEPGPEEWTDTSQEALLWWRTLDELARAHRESLCELIFRPSVVNLYIHETALRFSAELGFRGDEPRSGSAG